MATRLTSDVCLIISNLLTGGRSFSIAQGPGPKHRLRAPGPSTRPKHWAQGRSQSTRRKRRNDTLRLKYWLCEAGAETIIAAVVGANLRQRLIRGAVPWL